MWSLVSREICSIGAIRRVVPSPGMVPGGTSYSMTDETFIVSNMFGTLCGGEIDSVHVHCHGVFHQGNLKEMIMLYIHLSML